MDRFLFRAAIKTQNYSILVDVSEVFTSGYSVLIDSIIDAFQNKYPDADVWGFIEMLENIPNCSEISDQAGVVLFDTFEGLLQCTNLKDKNGNLIYEGDIVKVPEDWDEYGWMAGEEREVYFCDGGFRFKPNKHTFYKNCRGHWMEDVDGALEIVGNICD